MRLTGVLDRLEEEYGVILLGEEEIKVNWPRAFLPANIREGQYVSFDLTIDYKKTEESKKEIEAIWQKLNSK